MPLQCLFRHHKNYLWFCQICKYALLGISVQSLKIILKSEDCVIKCWTSFSTEFMSYVLPIRSWWRCRKGTLIRMKFITSSLPLNVHPGYSFNSQVQSLLPFGHPNHLHSYHYTMAMLQLEMDDNITVIQMIVQDQICMCNGQNES